VIILSSVATASRVCAQDEPPLPPGLSDGQNSENDSDADSADDQGDGTPALPPGLDGGDSSDDDASSSGEGPALPEGLGEGSDDGESAADSESQESDESTEAKKEDQLELPNWMSLTGFWEVRGGVRTQRDSHQRDASIGETRLQLESQILKEKYTFNLTTDFLYDAVPDGHAIDLERGEGFVDLRELSLAFTPVDFMDVKVGRQVLTWGTGDLLFLNDMFPKDWQSYFIGRDVEYLKAPSDAIKLSMYSDIASWDVVFTPRFDPDRFITGERISYFDPIAAGRVGRDKRVNADIPDDWFRNHEWSTRVKKMIEGYELAAYGYWGYWKSPGGFDILSQEAIFPRLNVYGASVRGPFAGGIGNVEAAYYDSREDREGTRPFIDNSEFRVLTGYERDLSEIMKDFTVGLQYYVEIKMNYDDYRRTLPPIMPADDPCRHVTTVRLTKLLMNQNLKLSLFAYYSPSDSDAYLRPLIEYKITDHWTTQLGGNVFIGNEDHTFFGQFARNSNIYASLRYGF
jgi:hypothetical protein